MMNFISKYKAALILLVLILLGFWAFSNFFGEAGFLLEPVGEPVGEEVFEVLAVLRGINLDGRIFSDPDFLTLQDFETEVLPGRAGRANPFSPTGSDSGGTIVEPTYKVLPISTAENFLEEDGSTEEPEESATTTPDVQ